MKIGVLALQGAFLEHIEILRGLGAAAVTVRLPKELQGLDGLIIPGGESTSIMNLMHSFSLVQPLKKLAQSGVPVWGTCAGMICLANEITGSNNLKTLALMEITVKRNAFGRQIDSFETDLNIPALGKIPYHAVFIRAPVITGAGKSVTVLAELVDGTPVAARQDSLLVTSFHPELTGDHRFHRYFLKMASGK
ncbi:MAG: pyridoxal 5'-phosphate synthase glutaminase subunit PdxT [Dehalococcoidales bacterium]|nr:pyridoxal 5'-phosphate synthase glutaminase subunit PdxT [Dehalococcoidales bacterium]